jgi:hypothetical protein
LTETANSFQLLKQKGEMFNLLSDDILPRFVSCSNLIDPRAGIMAGGDKMGNFFISKVSSKTLD